MNIMTIIILAILLIFAATGFTKGAVKHLSGIISLAISCLLVSFLLPYASQMVRQYTPVYDWTEKQVDRVIDSFAAKAMPEKKQEVPDRERLRELLSWSSMDSSVVDGMTDEELIDLAVRVFPDYFPQLTESGTGKMLGDLTKNEQTRLIQKLPIPDFMKNMMLTYNNSEGYRKLGITNFRGYLVSFIANVIGNAISFLGTLLVSFLAVSLAIMALDLVAKLPFLRTVNHLGGLVVGTLEGLFVVWLIFLVISMMSGTAPGMAMMEMINESFLLKPLYDSNLFMVIAVSAVRSIL